jgi:hypothetical protein
MRSLPTEKIITWGDKMTCRSMLLGIGISLFTQAAVPQQADAQATYTLKATPKTVAWGYYDAKAAPVLRIKSRDTLGKMDPHGIRALTVHSKNSGAGFLADML